MQRADGLNEAKWRPVFEDYFFFIRSKGYSHPCMKNSGLKSVQPPSRLNRSHGSARRIAPKIIVYIDPTQRLPAAILNLLGVVNQRLATVYKLLAERTQNCRDFFQSSQKDT
jgi:hypothetical protein